MNRLRWAHPKRGFFRRADGKGVVNHVGPRDWSALIVNEGGRIQPVGNGHTAAQAMTFVDQAAPPCETCEGSGRMCGYHGPGDCECGGSDCPDCRGK